MVSPFFLNNLRKAKERDLGVIQLIGATEALKKSEGIGSAIALYKAWIDSNADNPMLYAVLFNASALLTETNAFDEAEAYLTRAIELNPDFAPPYINLGRLYERKGKTGLAITQWSKIVDKLNTISGSAIMHKTTALNQMARVLEANNQDETAENLLEQSLEIDTTQREVAQHYLAARQRECKWPLIQPRERLTRPLLMKGISPLSLAVYTDDPMLQLAANAHYNICDVGMPEPTHRPDISAACKELKKNEKLRIGYLSSDLREHAIGFLMSEVFGLHDRKKVEVFAYYCGIKNVDATMERIKASVDHWVPINDMDDQTAAKRMAQDGIHILIDVNGYTRDGRTKLISLKPAPIIVNWLGFPGTMGGPDHHYIIADPWIIPPEHEIYFSEKVLRLPCYQPNDRNRIVADVRPTRTEAHLPENAIVYCCFNGTQKISRHTFDRWMSILERVPDSVLWLLSGTDSSQKRLKALMQERGLSPERLIFAEKKKNAHHLARYPLADLFLDTAPYGAHTTASDALWMGVPVLTLDGRSFASRVCGSLVRAAGLGDLACATSQEYIDRAVALGKNKKALQKYRTRLATTRDTCDLFNTPQLVKKLEKLFEQMWKDFTTGHLPQPDLRNLDIYLETGIGVDHDAVELQSLKDYTGWWGDMLAKRHALRPIPYDNRLWMQPKPHKTKAKKAVKKK